MLIYLCETFVECIGIYSTEEKALKAKKSLTMEMGGTSNFVDLKIVKRKMDE